VVGTSELSSKGLRDLARLEQLTSLGFCRGLSTRTVSKRRQKKLSDPLQGCKNALVNTVRGLVAWCPKAL